MLDLNQVVLFVEVVRSGSFAGAARRLGIPPNSISRKVRQLEEGLGSRLMHRSTRKLSLTAAGQTLFERCEHAIADISQAGQDLMEGGGLTAGLVRVAAPASFINSYSVAWLGEFMAAHPRVRIEFILSDARADLIADGIDVAFRAAPANDADSVVRPLFENYFVLVASPEYLAAHGTPSNLRELDAHDCLAQGTSNRLGSTVWRLEGPDGPREVSVLGRFIANTAGAVLQAALAGFGIALLPAVHVALHVRTGRLVRVLPDYRRAGGGLQLVLPSRRQIPRAVAAFAAFVTDRMQQDWQEHASDSPPRLNV